MKTMLMLGCLVVAGQVAVFAGGGADGYVAHEWGTFTSLQDAEGSLLSWKPLVSSQLPGFVYDWKRPGLERSPVNPQLLVGKGMQITFQRLETPVIYFYSEKEQMVDVQVDFPAGFITEWYPQASQIGPGTLAVRSGADTNTVSPKSMIRWSGVTVLPSESAEDANGFPTDNSGSHYFSARGTDARNLAVTAELNGRSEHEKFLFYRGVGNFRTRLDVSMPGDSSVVITNTGDETFRHVFVLEVKDGRGGFVYLDQLPGGQQRTIAMPAPTAGQPLEALKTELGGKMAESLVAEGLYPREAGAMVDTWKDSWFAEEGVRVLYVLPRAWTDRILPITISPAPRELVRVMVGRAEVLTSGTEQQLAQLVTSVNRGDPGAMDEAHASLKKLGRFADVALQRALWKGAASPAARKSLVALLPQPEARIGEQVR